MTSPLDWVDPVLFVLLESGDPVAEQLVARGLHELGFEVPVATIDGQDRSVVFDYSNDTYAVVVLTGTLAASEPAPGHPGPPGGFATAGAMKLALVMPGTPAPLGLPGALYVALADDGDWVRAVAERWRPGSAP